MLISALQEHDAISLFRLEGIRPLVFGAPNNLLAHLRNK